ncbi:endonuclease dU [Natronorubrum sulfidifaciens]|uniref:UPF0215 protein C495_05087 n=1 Tax=Natronorubrum sulfidifaciens JCM 14089 TaxID=1230460 RepID=L9WDP3_9EURY|nr:DUF99 family protein [Natronorubrum sulfidifaciens]ELY47605.1 hypothetical protein C495_05087 [Natronorubrum sulfidifaciens JCM 14089]
MKPGARALGIAESFGRSEDRSTLAGSVVRADRVLDGLAYRPCTVGGTDATDAVTELVGELGRPDVQYVLVGAVAPAWYNLLDVDRIHEIAERPVVAVTFETSDGLETALQETFSGPALEARLERYRALPARRALTVNDETIYIRHVGCGAAEAAEIVREFTPEGGRPEPIRVARQAARAGDAYVHSLE